MPDLFETSTRDTVVRRLRSLTPDRQPQWGRMNAPQMVAHLSDQMRHCLGDVFCKPRRGLLRLSFIRYLSIYWIPWPKGLVKGPLEMFRSTPGVWADDVAELERLLERFAARSGEEEWPEQAMFGPMSRQDWGVFCYKHFDHHLRQFSA